MKHLKHMKHTFSTHCNISLLLGRMEAHRRVEFAGGSGPMALVNGQAASAT
jgi:hypothetical protein